MIDPTDRRYHILKDTSTKCKNFKLKFFDDEIKAEKSYQVSGNGSENNESKSGESGSLYPVLPLVPRVTLGKSTPTSTHSFSSSYHNVEFWKVVYVL